MQMQIIQHKKIMEKFKTGSFAALVGAGFFAVTVFIGAGLANAQSVPTSTVSTATSATSTPMMLSIDQDGNLMAQGMTVTGVVASGSFDGQVWGIIYTVNVPASSTPNIGDMVDVAGTISSSSPLTVNATSYDDLTSGSSFGTPPSETTPPSSSPFPPTFPSSPTPSNPFPTPSPFPTPTGPSIPSPFPTAPTSLAPPSPVDVLNQLQSNLGNLMSQLQNLENSFEGNTNSTLQ
jgi:hypothetical protein